MALKVYIAGKVSGEPLAQCTMKFGTAQKEIEACGWIAINPLEVISKHAYGLHRAIEWEEAMKVCLTCLLTSDAVYVLRDWQDSPGATIEVELAKKLKLKIIYPK